MGICRRAAAVSGSWFIVSHLLDESETSGVAVRSSQTVGGNDSASQTVGAGDGWGHKASMQRSSVKWSSEQGSGLNRANGRGQSRVSGLDAVHGGDTGVVTGLVSSAGDQRSGQRGTDQRSG